MVSRDDLIEAGIIDPFKRVQRSLWGGALFPAKKDGLCDCGCGKPLSKRRTRWATKQCQSMYYDLLMVMKGDLQTIRACVFYRDQGFCRHCGVLSENWEADHIIPVHKGGGGCDLSNFQTLCKDCHKTKTRMDCHGY